MKYFKISLLAIVSRIKFNVVIVLQLVIVICVMNILIGSINSRQMLIDPYEGMIDKQGFYFMDFLSEDMGMPQLNEKAQIFNIRQVAASLPGDESFHIYIVPDDFMEKLSLPLVEKKQANEPSMILFRNNNPYHCGDKMALRFDGIPCEMTISGILTNNSYIPAFTSIDYASDINLFYKRVSKGLTDGMYAIMNESDYSRLGFSVQETYKLPGMIVYYPDEISEDDYESDRAALETVGWTRDLSDIYDMSLDNLNDMYRKYIPLAIIVVMIIILGVVFSIGIQTMEQLKNYSVYYLCGLKWSDTMFINLMSNNILTLFSAILSIVILGIVDKTGKAAEFGLVFNGNNFIASIVLIVMILFVSAIAPMVIVCKQQPSELIRKTKY